MTNILNKLGQWWCGLAGRHQNVAESDDKTWHLRCIKCGARTPGWDLAKRQIIRLTQADIDGAERDMLLTELSLHGGG